MNPSKSRETPAPRQIRDECCDICRALPGDGPWCPCRGKEMPGEPYDETGWALDLCEPCEECFDPS